MIRDLMIKLGGPPPEDYPACDHITEARKRIKSSAPLLEVDPDAEIDKRDLRKGV